MERWARTNQQGKGQRQLSGTVPTSATFLHPFLTHSSVSPRSTHPAAYSTLYYRACQWGPFSPSLVSSLIPETGITALQQYPKSNIYPSSVTCQLDANLPKLLPASTSSSPILIPFAKSTPSWHAGSLVTLPCHLARSPPSTSPGPFLT